MILRRGRKDGLKQWDTLSSKVEPIVIKSVEICLQKWDELSSKSGASCLLKWGELSSKSGASCLGASFMWGELSWGELSLGRVVLIPEKRPTFISVIKRLQKVYFRFAMALSFKQVL